jgi:hypothetical protein
MAYLLTKMKFSKEQNFGNKGREKFGRRAGGGRRKAHRLKACVTEKG